MRQTAILFSAVILIGLLALAGWNLTHRPSHVFQSQPAIKTSTASAMGVASPGQSDTIPPAAPAQQDVLHAAGRVGPRGGKRVALRWLSPSEARKIKLPHGFHLAEIPWTGGLRHDTLPPNVTSRAPPLDRQRQAANAIDGNARIQFTSNFPCGTPVKVKRLSPTHYVLTVTGPEVATSSSPGTFHLWFLIRLSGTKGKIIRLDFTNSMIKACQFANPLYSYCNNLNNPKNFVSQPVSGGRAQFGYNGPILPDTGGQKWHFVVNVWREGKNLCLVQKFTHNHAYLSFRYPYTPKLNEAYMAKLKGNPYCRVVNIGKSKEGRPLLAVEIPRPGNTPEEKAKPCVLIYAREHADEVDSGWVAYGAMRFLLSNNPAAQAARASTQFIIIPMLDPDGAAQCYHNRITDTFIAGNPELDSKEAIQYTNFCQKWIDSGRPIDITNDLHEGQPSGKPDFYCPDCYHGQGQLRISHLLLERIKARVSSCGCSASARAERSSPVPDRLAGFVNSYYGSLMLPFEVNSQGVYRHLTLRDIRLIGSALVVAEARFLSNSDGRFWIEHIERELAQRRLDWKRFGRQWIGASALVSEQRVRWHARRLRLNRLITEEGLSRVADSHVTGWKSPGDPW